MRNKILCATLLLTVVPTTFADKCGEYRPYCPKQPASCCRSGDPESVTQESGAFVTGPPRGEVSGESNSVGLRLGRLRIPEISIGLPTIQLPSLVRYRQDPMLHTESHAAPFVRGEVAEFGLRPRGVEETTTQPETSAQPETNPTCVPAVPQMYSPEQYCPPQYRPAQPPCGEGCAAVFGQDRDPWKNTAAYELHRKQQQVDRLEAQVGQLQQLVEKLVENQESVAVANRRPASTLPAAVDSQTSNSAVRFVSVQTDTRPIFDTQPVASPEQRGPTAAELAAQRRMESQKTEAAHPEEPAKPRMFSKFGRLFRRR